MPTTWKKPKTTRAEQKALLQLSPFEVKDKLMALAAETEKEGQFPAHALFKKMGDAGLLGVDKPVEFGGSGLDFSYAMVCSESLGLVNGGSVPMGTGVQISMATPALARAIPHSSQQRNGAALLRHAARQQEARRLRLCGLRPSALHVGRQIPFGHRLAQLLSADRFGKRCRAG